RRETRSTPGRASPDALGDHRGGNQVTVEGVRVGDPCFRDLSRRLDRDDLAHAHGDGATALLELDRLHARLDRLELLEPVRSNRRVAGELGLLAYVRPANIRAQGRQDAVDLAPVEGSIEIREQPHLVFEGHGASVTPR